jgi:hypothetical protein
VTKSLIDLKKQSSKPSIGNPLGFDRSLSLTRPDTRIAWRRQKTARRVYGLIATWGEQDPA